MAWDGGDALLDLLDVFSGNDYESSVLGGRRDKGPNVYHGLLIGVVLVLAVLVYLLLW